MNEISPVAGTGEYDELDVYGTFTSQEAARLGVIPVEGQLEGRHGGSSATSEQTMLSETFEKMG